MNKLKAAAVTATVAAFTILGTSTIAQRDQPANIPEPEWLPIPDDIPLVSDYHKQLAQLDGYAVYQWDGVWYVDPNLPEHYWKE